MVLVQEDAKIQQQLAHNIKEINLNVKNFQNQVNSVRQVLWPVLKLLVPTLKYLKVPHQIRIRDLIVNLLSI